LVAIGSGIGWEDVLGVDQGVEGHGLSAQVEGAFW